MSTNTTASPSNVAAPARVLRERSYACISIIAFVLFLYGDILFSRSGAIVSHVFGDACGAHFGWRQFGYGELAEGNLPLWNPYVFCGAPFAGNIQSAMFYPVNAALHLLLPIATAINAEIVFHILLAGISMLAWVRSRGAGWLACVLAAAVAMAGAPVCMRLNLGQLNVIAVYAWLPLTLLCIDKLFDRFSLGWLLLGICAATMQLLGGYPPAAYNNAFAIALYCALRLWQSRQRLSTTTTLAVLALFPILLSAAAIATGYHTARESLRAEGTTLEFASSWSLPLENLLTAFTPLLFGDYTHVNYWGRWCLWDVCIFMGIGSFFLLTYGTAYAPKQSRKFAGTLLLVLVLTALGRYTPFFTALYTFVPGISSFRAPSKFLLPALPFAAMLIGLGAHEFMLAPKRPRPFAVAATVCAVLLLAVGLALLMFPSIQDKNSGLWALLVASMEQSGEAYWWFVMDDEAMERSVWIAAMSALIAAATCIVIAYLLHKAQSASNFRTALVCFSIVEVLCFARYVRVTTDTNTLTSPTLAALRQSDPGDYREIQAKSINPNWRRNFPADIKMKTAWGYDPVMLRRYAEFIAFALGGKHNQHYLVNEVMLGNILDPISMGLMSGIFRFNFEPKQNNNQYPFVGIPSLFRLTRCKYVYFWPEGINSILGGVEGVFEVRDPLPRFAIYRDYRVIQDKQALLEAMASYEVDLAKTVFLEEDPGLPSNDEVIAPLKADRIAVVGESTDYIEIEVETDKPGLLFITDAYSNGWTATSFSHDAATTYEILPADYAFQAIPIGVGNHKIRLEYAPKIVTRGIQVSTVAIIAYFCLMLIWAWGQLRKSRAEGLAR